MNGRINLKIIRIGIDNYGEPYTVNIRAVVDALDPLKVVAERFRQASERAIPAQLMVPSETSRATTTGTVTTEDIEQVIMEGLVSMKHSGQIAKEIAKRFGGHKIVAE
jgi:hypothetical protein